MTAIIPKISHLSNSIIRVLGCNPSPMTLQGTNTYIIGTGKKRILFDTGEPENKEYITNLVSVFENENISLHSVIISHWHHDHIGGLKNVLQNLADKKDISILKFPRENPKDDPAVVSLKQLTWLNGNEEIKVEGATVRVLHTPGHTTDHIVLELIEENAIFSGDCILGEGTAVFEDLYDYMKSLQIILDKQPSVIYPGHGPVIKSPVPKIKYYINHRNERESQISQVLQENLNKSFSSMDLVKKIYTETPKHLYVAAANNVSLHLVKLAKEGQIMQSPEEEGRWMLNKKAKSSL